MSRSASPVSGKPESLWTADEVAAFLRVTPRQVARLVAAGLLARVKVASSVRFRRVDVDAYIASCVSGAAASKGGK